MKRFNRNTTAIIGICLLLMGLNACQNQVEGPDPLVEETIYEIPYGESSLQKFDIYLPADRSADTKVLIFIHGGGWSGGDKSDYVLQLAGLQDNGFAIANIDYRLATGAGGITLEQQEADIRSCIDYIRANAAKFVISPDKIILAGHSAGGHLALYTAYTNNADGAIKAAVSLAGPTNLPDPYFLGTPDLNSLIENLLGTSYIADTAAWVNASPLTFASAEVPPTLLQYCGLDFTVPAGQGDILNNALNIAGVDHQYYLYPLYSHDMGTIFYSGNLPPDLLTNLLDFIDAHAN